MITSNITTYVSYADDIAPVSQEVEQSQKQ